MERGLIRSILSSHEDENSLLNGRFLGSEPLCVERCRRIVSRSALIVASGPLIGTASALAGDSRTLIVASGPLIVATSALAGDSRTLIVTSGSLIVASRALADQRRTLIVMSGRLLGATRALAGQAGP